MSHKNVYFLLASSLGGSFYVFLADHKKQVLDHTCQYVNLFCPSLSSLCFCGSPHHVFANLDYFFSKFAPRPRMHFMCHRLFHLCSPCARHVSHRNLFIFEEMGYWPPVSAVDAPFLRSYGKQVCFGPVSPCIMTTYDNSQVHSNGVKPSVCASPAPLTLRRSPTPPKQLRTGRLCLHSRHPPEAMVVGHRRYFPSIVRPLIFTIAQT